MGSAVNYVRNLRAKDLELSVRDGYIVGALGLYRQDGETERIGDRTEKYIP